MAENLFSLRNTPSPHRKRSRGDGVNDRSAELSMSIADIMGTADIESPSTQNGSTLGIGGGGRASISSFMRSADIDELSLLNEQLMEKNRLQKDHTDREKDKFVRQLQFLENENAQLRKSVTEKTEKYFEDKKKWQAKLREVADTSTNNSLSMSISSSSRRDSARSSKDKDKAGSTSNGSSLGLSFGEPSSSSTVAQNDRKFAELDSLIREQAEDMRTCKARNAELEEECKRLEVSLVSARTQAGQVDSWEVESQRDLRKLCDDLEADVRRKTRLCERLEKKIQNQALLEEEISTLSTKLKLRESQSLTTQALESRYQLIASEKKDWTELFSGIINTTTTDAGTGTGTGTGSSTTAKGEVEITPAMVLRTLTDTQRQCALLLRSSSDQQSECLSLRQQLLRSEAQTQKARLEAKEALAKSEASESSVRLQKHQVRLYEGEIKSLRSLVESVNEEMLIGKGDGKHTTALLLKDKAIKELQSDLSSCRSEMKSAMDELASRMSGTSPTSATTSADTLTEQLTAAKDELVYLKRQNMTLRDEMLGIQRASGIDFAPDSVRVLHLAKNPADAALAAKGLATVKVSRTPHGAIQTPVDEMKAIREENSRLRGLLLQHTGPDSNTGNTAARLTPSSASTSASVTVARVPVVGVGPDSAKMNQRLKEMFKERITCFREAVYLLTGYKVE